MTLDLLNPILMRLARLIMILLISRVSLAESTVWFLDLAIVCGEGDARGLVIREGCDV